MNMLSAFVGFMVFAALAYVAQMFGANPYGVLLPAVVGGLVTGFAVK